MSATMLRRSQLLAAAAAVLLCAAYASAQQADPSLPDPTRMLTQNWNCTGWPEPRMWIEAQSWWTDAGLEGEIAHQSRHFHMGACLPYNQTVSGTIIVDVLIITHNNPDYMFKEVYFLAPLPYNSTAIYTDTANHKIGSSGIINFHCPPGIPFPYTCPNVYRVAVDTTKLAHDGLQSLRLRAETALQPGVPVNLTAGNGYTYAAELSVRMRFANGKPALPVKADPNHVDGSPTIAAGFNDFPWSYTRLTLFKDALPTRPLTGQWTIRRLESFDQRLYGRVTPVVAPVTRSFVSLDPKFHMVTNGTFTPAEGTVQLDVPNMIAQDLTIDTTKLANGKHIFFIRTDSTLPAGTILPDTIPWLPGVTHAFSGGKPHPGGTQSAVLTFAFFVDNPVPAAAAPSGTGSAPSVSY